MKRKLIAIAVMICMMFSLSGCNFLAKRLGGDITIELEPNRKMINVTWKDDDSLWILTRPMTKDDIAETYLFEQDSNFGIIEGSVTFIESKEESV